MSDLPRLENAEIARYSRHLILDEVGMEGQQKLKASKVLCRNRWLGFSYIDVFGCEVRVGRIGIVDFDVVDESNLQRQVLHMAPQP